MGHSQEANGNCCTPVCKAIPLVMYPLKTSRLFALSQVFCHGFCVHPAHAVSSTRCRVSFPDDQDFQHPSEMRRAFQEPKSCLHRSYARPAFPKLRPANYYLVGLETYDDISSSLPLATNQWEFQRFQYFIPPFEDDEEMCGSKPSQHWRPLLQAQYILHSSNHRPTTSPLIKQHL